MASPFRTTILVRPWPVWFCFWADLSSALPFDETIKKKLADNDGKILEAVSRSWFPNPEAKAQCLYFVKHLRVHRVRIPNTINVRYRLTPDKNLFMHTYVHLVTCCRSEYVPFPFIQSRELILQIQASSAYVGGQCQPLEGIAQCAATNSTFLDQRKHS